MVSSKLRQQLYVITDEHLMPPELFNAMAEQALKAGTGIIQYRDKSSDTQKRLKQAEALRTLTEAYDAVFIINDDVELCVSVGADGVHIGQDDAGYDYARSRLGDDKVIGMSCYADIGRALTAQTTGADYVAFGRFFPSGTKPNAKPASLDILHHAKADITVPIVAIGGITLDNAESLIRAGASTLAVIGDVFGSSNITERVSNYLSIIQQ